jgi:hypothetical protein
MMLTVNANADVRKVVDCQPPLRANTDPINFGRQGEKQWRKSRFWVWA